MKKIIFLIISIFAFSSFANKGDLVNKVADSDEGEVSSTKEITPSKRCDITTNPTEHSALVCLEDGTEKFMRITFGKDDEGNIIEAEPGDMKPLISSSSNYPKMNSNKSHNQ